MMLLLATDLSSRLVRLTPIDVVIVVFYFILVLSLGWYLRSRSNTGEDFFMAGREMTAWVAGLSFLSANLGERVSWWRHRFARNRREKYKKRGAEEEGCTFASVQTVVSRVPRFTDFVCKDCAHLILGHRFGSVIGGERSAP
jgi:hypothetical protein